MGPRRRKASSHSQENPLQTQLSQLVSPLPLLSSRGRHWLPTNLLDCIEHHLPKGMNDWEVVAAHFNRRKLREHPERDSDSMRSKYKTLRSARKSTV